MSKYLRLVCFLFLLGSIAAHAAQPGDVVVIPVRGEISEAQFFFLRRALKNAEEQKAGAIILDMDTYGGEVKAAIDEMNALMKSSVPTYTYVNSKAISAGAMITIATQKIYMSPTAVIGASAPVGSSGEDLSNTMKDKVVSTLSAIARAASQKNGYNTDVTEAFINKDKEVKIGEIVINPKGSLLSLSAQEASKLYDQKPLLATGIADSMEDLVKREKLTGAITVIEPTGFEKLAFWITQLAPLFLLGGIIGAWLEIKFQGTLIPGICAGICFLIFFTGHYIAGLSGWEVVVVFFIGLLLLLSELFVHPGTILPGMIGALMIIGSLFWAMVDHYPNQPWVPSGDMLMSPALNLGAAMLASVLVIYLLGKFLPSVPFFNRMVLGTAGPQGPSLSLTSVDSPMLVHVGNTGVAKSYLRPSGKAMFGEYVLDVVTEGEFVDPETRVRVVAVEGARIVVQSCK